MSQPDPVSDLDSRWRHAEAARVMLRDALKEFHGFVIEHLDNDPLPVTGYLAGWPDDRLDELAKELAS